MKVKILKVIQNNYVAMVNVKTVSTSDIYRHGQLFFWKFGTRCH